MQTVWQENAAIEFLQSLKSFFATSKGDLFARWGAGIRPSAGM
jgi:hypothetical protein